MKKLLTMILALILIFAVGCKSEEKANSEEEKKDDTNKEVVDESKTKIVKEKAREDGVVLTVGKSSVDKEYYKFRYELTKREMQKNLPENHFKDEKNAKELSDRTLEYMANMLALENLATEKGHKAKDEEVEQKYKEFKESADKDLLKYLEKDKYSEKGMKKVLSQQITVNNYLKTIYEEIEKSEEFNKIAAGVNVAKASHILVEKEEDAKKIYEEVKANPEKFEEIAKEKSTDKSSAVKGGDLGYFGPNQMVKEFDEAVFKAKSGDLIAPVKTQFGYHIIKVSNITDLSTALKDEKNSTMLFNTAGEIIQSIFRTKVDSIIKEEIKKQKLVYYEIGE